MAEQAAFCSACGEATASPAALIGREIAGRYRILEKLGEGGMGAVYRAEQISLKRTIALKLLRPEVAASQTLLRRFNTEAEAVAKLRHPNTINIYDFGQDSDGVLFIAMELIEGRSLRAVLHAEAPLSLRRALAIASQIAASLADAHARTIVHRDMKPDNVMLTDRGRARDHVTVLDFGIAKLRDESSGSQQAMTQAGDMLGTPQYMAPEQIRGEAIDGRADIYALGCMLYEMLTGRLPYEAQTIMALLSKHLLEYAVPPSQCRPDLGIPPAMDDLVMRALAKDPSARPATMEEYGEQIGALLAALPPEPSAQRSAVGAVPALPSGISTAPPVYSPAPMYSPPSYGAPSYPPHATGAPPQQMPLRPPARSPWLGILIGLVIVGGGAGLYFASRSDKAVVVAEPAKPDEVDPDELKREWKMHVQGDVVEVAQGVKIIAPPGMPVARDSGAVIIGDAKEFAIIAAPITEPGDEEELAASYGKLTGLTLINSGPLRVAGQRRMAYSFSGALYGVGVTHLAVPLLGENYRVAVIIQHLLNKEQSQSTARAIEILDQRVIVPKP